MMRKIIHSLSLIGRFVSFVVPVMAVTMICGCESLPAYEKIDKLRVLAVRAARPQIRIGDTAEMDALVVTPDASPVQLTWQACIYTLDADHKRACPPDAVIATGAGSTFQFQATEQSAAAMRRICEKDPSLLATLPKYVALPECDRLGYPLSVRMVATLGAESVETIKRVWITDEETLEATANPAIDGYSGLPKTLVPGSEYQFNVLASPGWIPTDPEDAQDVEDKLLYTWFVLGGDFNYMEEKYNDDLAPQTIFLKARSEDTQVQMWILVRDYFGGVDWQHLQFDVVTP